MARSPTHRRETATRALQAPADPPRTYVLDRASVRAVDRAAVEEFGIPGLVLMENAARGLADHALALLAADPAAPRAALIICGRGNNGGDGYALARHLHNAGVAVTLVALADPEPSSDAGVNADICRRMKLPIVGPDAFAAPPAVGLVVDAVLGTGLDRAVEGPAAEAIDWINRAARPVLAVDVPSGLDCDTGQPLGRAVRATRTVTFVGLKPGFLELAAQPFVGEVHVAGIGAPRELLERLGRPLPPAPPDRPGEPPAPAT